MKRVGERETGIVYVQYIDVANESGTAKRIRLTKMVLNDETRNGDKELSQTLEKGRQAPQKFSIYTGVAGESKSRFCA